MSAEGRTWFRCDTQVHRDPKVRELMAVHGTHALSWWVTLMAEAKASRQVGTVTTTLIGFGADVADTPNGDLEGWRENRIALLRHMERLGMISLTGDFQNVFEIVLPGFSKWQTMAANAEHQRDYRARQGVSDRKGTVRDASGERQATVSTLSGGRQGSESPSPPCTPPSHTGEGRTEKAHSSKTPRRSSPSPDQVQDELERCGVQLGIARAAVDRMADVMAEQNKTGKVQARRVLRKLYLPLTEAMAAEGLSPDAIKYGADAAAKNDAPNANYALQAARNYRPPSTNGVVKQLQPLPNPQDDPDVEWVS